MCGHTFKCMHMHVCVCSRTLHACAYTCVMLLEPSFEHILVRSVIARRLGWTHAGLDRAAAPAGRAQHGARPAGLVTDDHEMVKQLSVSCESRSAWRHKYSV